MIVVVVDTTATFGDVMMTSTRWMQLLTLTSKSEIELVVPDVVLRETARHWSAQTAADIEIINKRIDKLAKSKEWLAHLGVDATGISPSTAVVADTDPTTFATEQHHKLAALGVDVRPVPASLDIETVLQRDLSRKKPFQPSGKGFRDTLAWETFKDVIEATSATDQVCFVTDNSSDYCDSTGQLAAELLAELASDTAHITRFKDLKELLDDPLLAPLVAAIAKTDAELAEFLAAALTDATSPDAPAPVAQVVANAVQSTIEQLTGEEVYVYDEGEFSYGHNFSGLDLPAGLMDVTIDVLDVDEDSLTWQTYATYDDTTVLIEAEIDADISLIAVASKFDAVQIAGQGNVSILDPDYNDHVAEIALSTSGRLIFQLRVEHGMNYAEMCELERVEPLP